MKHFYLVILSQFLLIAATAQENRSIRLKNGVAGRTRNLRNETAFNEARRDIQYNNRLYTIIQFNRLPGETEKKAMAADGIVLYNYISGNAYLAELPENFTPATLNKYNAGGLYQLDASSKISTRLLQQPEQAFSNPDDYIAISFFGTVNKNTVISELKKTGAQIASTKIQPENVVFVKASSTVVQKIARLPFVAWISKQRIKDVPINYLNKGSQAISALNFAGGRNLQGKDITVGVGDNADPSTHIDFTGRLINRTPLPPASHGTHVTGTFGGAGIINPKYKGMAPKATIVSQFYSDVLVNTPFYTTDFGMVLTNNSYHGVEESCPGEGEYDILSNFVDDQMNNDLELLHVFAAGNDGGLTCSPYPAFYGTVKSGFQAGKNVFTVGSIDNVSLIISNFSSRGPVNDGRLKPEIVAGGSGVNSTTPNNNYGANWGTSMAAPTVTGAMALLYERYRQMNGGANPSASLIKAVTCNGADDVGNVGPDYTYGFGVLNARNAVEALEGNTYFTGSVSHSGTANFSITGVPSGTDRIKVLLYWADVAAAPFAPNALVNNLDLTVTAPGAIVHNPLILNSNPANVNDLAVEGVDNVNNIEQVVIYNPPAGNFDITVTGTNVPSGPQAFVVAYQVINSSLTLEYPFGSEAMVPNQFEVIRWNAYDGSNNTFTVEYSINNGASWTVLDNNVPATSRNYLWLTPNTPTNQGLVRVTRNGGGLSDVNSTNFTILAFPNPNLTNPCPGYVQLTWTTTASATGYDIMMLQGDSMQIVGATAGTSFLLEGLSADSSYWLAVRPKIGSAPGRHSIAKTITPSGGTCVSATYNNDFTIDTLLAPGTGRMFTASQLGVVAPQIRIHNLGAVASAGSYNISYQVNGGSVVTESIATVIPGASTLDYTFTSTFDFSATNTYTIKTWVSYGSDTHPLNDTITTVIKHLQNDAIVLSPDFTESFEGATVQTHISAVTGFDGLDRCDFTNSNSNGRARTFVNTGFARTGNRAITLDQKSFSFSSSADSLISTFNLSGYSSSDQLWLDFYYRNQGIDFSLPGNQVWIRGSENDAWIPVFTLPVDDPNDIGVYRASTPVNITEALTNAVPAQTVSSSFQVRFGQEGFTSANSVITNGNIDNGFTFDDVKLTNALNDVGVLSVVSPNITSTCTLSNTETIQVEVKNYSGSTVTNVAVSYDINGIVANEVIPSINAGQTLVYTFVQTADLSAFQQNDMSVWVNYPTDNYQNNDSLLNIVFNTVPVITSYPYLEDFESNDGYWYSRGVNNTWEWGAPANTIIDKAANGANAWVTNLTGNHANSELSYLYSPCFDLSSLTQPVLSFSHIFRMEDDCNCDFHWVEYSLDDITWIKLGAAGSGTNWYDNAIFQTWQASITRWQVSSFDIPTTASKVRFRFVMDSDPGVSYEGVGIDDVHVFDKAAIYNGADITSGLVLPVSGSNWIHFNSGGNRVVSINPNGQDLGNTEVKVFIHPGPVRISSNQYYLDRNIVIQPTNVPAGNVTVRYYFLDSEMDSLINASGCGGCHTVGDAYEAGVTQYSNALAEENGTLSDNLNGMYNFIPPSQVTVVPYDNGYYAEYQVSNFSEFWINSGGPGQSQSLPLVLGTFTVTKNNSTGLLQWTTLQETDIDKFIIEKSTNGVNFTTIGEVPAVGNSTTTQQYQFTDTDLVDGTNYYRLRIVDINEFYSFSPIRKINGNGNDFTISIHPNPVTQGALYISTPVNTNRIELRDVTGRLIISKKVQGTQHTLNVRHVAKGTYLLTIITDLGKKVEKIIID